MENVRHTGPVMVGVDGSDAGRSALHWAAELASRQQLPINLVHAAWIGPPSYATMGDFLQQMIDRVVEYGEQVLAEAKEELAAQFPELSVATTLMDGPAVPNLVGRSGQASVIVIGATGNGFVEGLLAGSVALELPPRSECPVVVVRGDGPADTLADTSGKRPVVVGVAGSELDGPAIEFAFEQASFRRSPLVALHVWSDTLLPPKDELAGVRTGWPEVEGMAHRMLSEQLAGWSDRFPDVDVTSMIAYDRPAESLLELAANAELAVVGTRGRGLLAGALLGSVSRTMIQRSPCPVAIVRTES